MQDIKNKADIKVFVDGFYGKVRVDPTIGPVFAAVIQPDQWPIHLERMYDFWNTILFAQADYRGNPFSKHATLPLEHRHFERWLALLEETLAESFAGEKVEEVKWRAAQMAMTFEAKLEYIRKRGAHTNLL
ncbi:MAG: group III truncated hemoglobin [Lewinella sp.]